MRPTITLSLMLLCVPASASVYIVDYNDLDAVHWTGEVDTDADTLTVTSFEPVEGSGLRAPVLPAVWPAKLIKYTPTGGPSLWDNYYSEPFDVQDGWTVNDGVFWSAGPVADWPLGVVGGWGGGYGNDQGGRMFGGGIGLTWGTRPGPIGNTSVYQSWPDTLQVTTQAVPEPSGLLIFGLLSLGLLGCRRAYGGVGSTSVN